MKMNLTIKVENESGKELTLTEEEARVLYFRLKSLFEENQVVTIPTYPNYPIHPGWHWTPDKDNPPIVTYGDNTGDVIPPSNIRVTCNAKP